MGLRHDIALSLYLLLLLSLFPIMLLISLLAFTESLRENRNFFSRRFIFCETFLRD